MFSVLGKAGIGIVYVRENLFFFLILLLLLLQFVVVCILTRWEEQNRALLLIILGMLFEYRRAVLRKASISFLHSPQWLHHIYSRRTVLLSRMETGGVVMPDVGSLDEEGIDRPTAFDTSDAGLLACGSGSRPVPGKIGHPGGIFGAYAWVRSVFC